ncbi:MAG: C39 family peptidase [Patescibacteria group bacterium]
MPFTSQAPDGVWTQPWFDACEEATITMVDAFYAGKSTSKAYAKDMIQRIVKFELKTFGFHRDTNAAQIADTINRYFPWEARVVKNPTLEDIKTELNAGRPVIIPVHGRALRNPYFRNGGPDYHTVVIAGYDDEKTQFIVQEPGTRHGQDFRYSYDTLLAATHDFLPLGRTRFGERVAIFTMKQLSNSDEIDADNDGLTKAEELRYGTVLWLYDSDGDGFSDGEEVKTGHSPTRK